VALEASFTPDHIFGTRFRYNEVNGKSTPSFAPPQAGVKLPMLEELRASLASATTTSSTLAMAAPICPS